MHQVVEPAEFLLHRLERALQVFFAAHVTFDEHRIAHVPDQLLDRLPEPLPLVREGQPGSRAVQVLGDGQGQASLVGDPENEAVLAGEVDRQHSSPMC